jgi:hypothetical protein
MKYQKYLFQNNFIKLIIEGEDDSGYYMYIFQNPFSERSIADYHYETLEEAFLAVEKRFSILSSQFQLC